MAQQPDTDGEEVRERDLVEAYLSEHALEPALNDAINQIVADRPEDPFLVLSTLLYARATAKRGIFHVEVREILDGTGAPTVLVRLHTGKGVFAASCSSEANGLPDRLAASADSDFGDFSDAPVPLIKQRFGGRGYRKRAELATQVLAVKLLNLEPTDQVAIDSVLIALEPDVGRNVCLAASIAACKAGARYADMALVEYIAKLQDAPVESLCVSMPLFSVVNAGQYASNKLYAQEVFVTPASAVSFADAYQIGATFSDALRSQLDARGVGFTNVGSFGGFAPQLQTLAELFQILRAALDETKSRLETGSAGVATASITPLRIEFGVDFAASEFVLPPPVSSTDDTSGDGSATRTAFSYNTDKWVPGSSGVLKTSEEMLDITRSALKELDIATVVDPFDCDDIATFAALLSAEHDQDASTDAGDSTSDGTGSSSRKRLGGDPNCAVQVVGKKLVVSHGLETLHDERACNTVLLHLDHFATLSRALETIADARRLGLAVVLGAGAGQSSDAPFLAALAIGAGVGQVKFGGLASADAIERYNELLLASEEPFAPGFVGDAYRR